jgi:hypothetical protein
MRKISLRIARIFYLLYFSAPLLAAEPTFIESSKKEGEVVRYTTMSVPESAQFPALFEEQYPLVKVIIVRAGIETSRAAVTDSILRGGENCHL